MDRMDFTYTDTQDMIRDTLARFLADTYGFETRQGFIASDEGRDPAIWTALAQDLGMLGAAFSAEQGGLGGGALENGVNTWQPERVPVAERKSTRLNSSH